MRSCIIVCLSVVVCPLAPLCAGEPAPDLSKFPKLQGKVVQTLGNFNVFVPPKAGVTFQLDLKEAPKLKALFFDEQRRRPDAAEAIPSVTLPAPLAVEAVRYNPKGMFRNLRLVSKKASWSVTIDVVQEDPEDPKLRVWVVTQQGDRVMAVALLECEADGAFPNRPK
jgi:hypothetical protein